MIKKKKSELKGSMNVKMLSGVMIFTFALVVLVMFLIINNRVSEQTEEMTKESIKNMNVRTAVAIEEKIMAKYDVLKLIAENIVVQEINTTQEVQEAFTPYAERYGFYRMGLVFPDGTCYISSGETIETSNMDFYSPCFQGKNVLSDAYLAKIGRAWINSLAVPVWKDGEIVCALTADYLSSDFAQMLDMGLIVNGGSSIVLDSQGKSVVNLSYSDAVNGEIMESIDQDEAIIPKDSMGKEHYFEFVNGETAYVAYMSPMRFNDWYLMSFFPKQEAANSMKNIQLFVTYATGILLVLLFIVTLLLMWGFNRYQWKVNNIMFVDSLIGKPNYEYLEHQEVNWEEYSHKMLASLDIDSFNMINTAYGSEAGDKILKYIDDAFETALPEDMLCRLHSDRFVAVLNTDDREKAKEKIQEFLGQIERGIAKAEVEAFSLSIGICALSECSSIHEGHMNALIAKGAAKRSGGNQYQFFDRAMRERQLTNLDMETAFEKALTQEEFQVFYQPKYDMQTRMIVGAEALIRWKRGDGTMVSPGDFIPCFEESGKIILLDEKMVEMVCRQMSEMQCKGIVPPRVSINLSRLHLKRPQYIISSIWRFIHLYDIDAAKLSFEMTETAMYQDVEAARKLVDALHEIGCQVDMDDYGSGMSGLQSLSLINFDTVKLDGGFIANRNLKKSEMIIRHTIRMIADIGINLVVEGVETKDQVDFLVENGCRYAQGYFYAKPMPKDMYEQLLSVQ